MLGDKCLLHSFSNDFLFCETNFSAFNGLTQKRALLVSVSIILNELSEYDLPHPDAFGFPTRLDYFIQNGKSCGFIFIAFSIEKIVRRKHVCGFIIFFALIKRIVNRKGFLYTIHRQQTCLFGHDVFPL